MNFARLSAADALSLILDRALYGSGFVGFARGGKVGRRVAPEAVQITAERAIYENCPCGGWDCSGVPGGPLLGCPYPEITIGTKRD